MAAKIKRLYVQDNGRAALFIDGKRHGFGTNTHTVDVDLTLPLLKYLLKEAEIEVVRYVDWRALLNGDVRVDDEGEVEARMKRIEEADALRDAAKLSRDKAQAIDDELTKRRS